LRNEVVKGIKLDVMMNPSIFPVARKNERGGGKRVLDKGRWSREPKIPHHSIAREKGHVRDNSMPVVSSVEVAYA